MTGSGPIANSEGIVNSSDLNNFNFNQERANNLRYNRLKRQSGLSDDDYNSYFDDY